jgi:Transposase DDE domain
MLCMVVLLQGYVGASDAEAVELSMVDLRWQMVLNCLGAATPPFSQGGLLAFRERMIAHEMDRVLLDRTVALVRSGAMTDAEGRSVSKALRAAIDSRPLAGAGKVEDTINLLGHAARSIVQLVSKLTDRAPEEICRKAGIPLLLAPSIKAGLDIDWSDPKQKALAVEVVERQVSSLQRWVDRHLDDAVSEPLRPYIEALGQVRTQDLEVAPQGGTRIRQGVAPDRRVSVCDSEMRHGRKSRSKRFDGYKEHIARDLDFPAIVACAVTPANRPEEEGAVPIAEDIRRQRLRLVELHIDRAYVNSPIVDDVFASRGTVFAKPWGLRNRPGLFTKGDFKIDLRAKTVTCPAGEVEPFEPGDTVEFDPEACGPCPLRAKCTQAAPSPSPPTKPGNASTASFSRHARAAPRSAAAPPSNTPSPISPPERDLGLATSASAAICSIYDEPPSSRTSRVSNGWRVPPNHRESQQSHHARRSRLASAATSVGVRESDLPDGFPRAAACPTAVRSLLI